MILASHHIKPGGMVTLNKDISETFQVRNFETIQILDNTFILKGKYVMLREDIQKKQGDRIFPCIHPSSMIENVMVFNVGSVVILIRIIACKFILPP